MAISKNSEILFIYDAKMSNPNGDMDNENKPRMDYDTDTNLVSDVRLKRYVRDYLENFYGMKIFITNKAKDAKERSKQIENKYSDMIDVRLFGAVFATTGGNDHLTGPIQFNWGYSLNPVELADSNTITSSFSSGGGIGKDYRVKYSVIAFDGTVNARIAENAELTDDDMKKFDNAMIKAIPYCKTRSKEGQTPRLYMRVELKDNQTILKDLREYVDFKPKMEDYKVRSVTDYEIDLSRLNTYLKEQADGAIVYMWVDDMLNVTGLDIETKAFNL